MSNQQQISGNAPKNYSRAIHKRVLSALIDYLKRQRRCFTAAALILFVFFGLNLLKSSADTLGLDKYNLFDKEEIIGENLIEEFSSSLFTRELLNSGMDMAAAIMPTAHAGVDFSADDEMERYYFDTVEENGALISQSNPVGADIFSGLRRDAIMYDVQEGDTVSDLAVKFGLTSNTILWANNLREKDIIKPGQQLAILPINGVRIKAAKNDTLAGLAKKYNAKTGEIIAFNHLLGEGSLVAGNFIIGNTCVRIAATVSLNTFIPTAPNNVVCHFFIRSCLGNILTINTVVNSTMFRRMPITYKINQVAIKFITFSATPTTDTVG